MNFDSRKLTLIPKFELSSDRLDGVAIVITAAGTTAEWLSLRDELRGKQHRPYREILAVFGNHGFRDFSYPNKERILRFIFLAQFGSLG